MDIKELINKAEIDPYKQLTPAPSILSIDNIVFGTLGNFSCVTGKSKTGKSFFLTLLMAAILDDKGKFQRLKTEVPNGTVLHFDTEQSEYHTQLVAKRVIKLVDSDKEKINYRCFFLRSFSNKEKIKVIEEIIYNENNLKVVVIDGIADLSIGYNDEKEAKKIVELFMKWSAELNIHIITIVHQNKGDTNAKGHLGSFILQKAETILSITKNNNISTVEATESRNVEILPISFTIDENGIPYFTDYTPKVSDLKKLNPTDYEASFHKNVLKEVFKNENEINNTDIIDVLKYTLQKHSINIGNTALRTWVIHYKTMNYISKENQQKPYKLNIS